MSTRIRANVSKYTHDNYATSGTPATKTPPVGTNTIMIENMDSSISVLVSFDAGVTFKTIKAGAALSIDIDIMRNSYTYSIKSASGTPSVECLYGSET